MENEKAMNELVINTPKGPIRARIIPDSVYPGIELVYAKEGTGEPGVIMEYTPTGDWANNVVLRVYTKENPNDEPVYTFKMS